MHMSQSFHVPTLSNVMFRYSRLSSSYPTKEIPEQEKMRKMFNINKEEFFREIFSWSF